MTDTAHIRTLLGSEDIQEVQRAIDAVRSGALEPLYDVVLGVMRDTPHGALRNHAAVMLSDAQHAPAISTLLALLDDPRTLNNRGTLLYALSHITDDPTPFLDVLVRFALHGNYEQCAEALHAIERFEGEIPPAMWQRCRGLLIDTHTLPNDFNTRALAYLREGFEVEHHDT